MTLYHETQGGFPVWRGEPVGDDQVSYPVDIETLWPAESLEAVGLWRDDMIAPADDVPDGKISTSQVPQRVGGVVKFVHTLGDAPVYVPSTPHIFAMGRFSVGDWEIGAISATMGIAGATMMDTGVYWIDFLEAQPDDDYIAIASDRGKSVTVTERYSEFCVVECTDMAGNPADPAEFVIQLTRVI